VSAAPSFAAHAAVLASVGEGGEARLRSAAADWAAEGGDANGLLRLLRFAHLFFGIPKVLRALNVLSSTDGALPATGARGSHPDAPAEGWQSVGESRFREVYGEDADRVLAHLACLDPVVHAWVLGHAYGRTGAVHGLPLPLAERLSVLALAATRCPDQCRSHLRAALRHGVPMAALDGDVDAAGWLDAAARATLRTLLRAESGDAEDPR
jgi:hypothetical protein